MTRARATSQLAAARISVADYGAVGDGTTDDTAAFDAAFAVIQGSGGGALEIPSGSYLLSDCEIPNTVDVTIIPAGEVKVKYPGTATFGALYARYITQGTHLSAPITLTGITQGDTTYPSASKQANAKLTAASGAFNALLPDEIVFIQSDVSEPGGFLEAEWGQVLATADAGATLFLTRPTNFDYSGFVNFTVRRVLSTPKLKILKGITFEPNGDTTATPISRIQAILLDAPIDAEIDAKFVGAWNIGVRLNSPFRGEYRCAFQDLHVDYSDNAYGYGLSIYGAGYRSKLWVYAENSGHAETLNGDANAVAWSSTLWYRHGVPTEIEIVELIANNTRRSAWDSHWSYRPRTHYLSVSGTTMDADESNNNTNAFGGAAVDPWFGVIVARDVYRCGYISDCYGVVTNFVIDSLQYDNPYAIAQRPIISYAGSTDAIQPVVLVNGGYSRMATSYHVDFNQAAGASARAPQYEFKNFTFFGGTSICRVLYDNYGTLRLMNCQWRPDGVNTLESMVHVFIAATNTTIVIDGMRVLQDANDLPDGIFRLVAAADTLNASVANLVCEQNAAVALTLYSASSDGAATVTALTVSAPTV